MATPQNRNNNPATSLPRAPRDRPADARAGFDPTKEKKDTSKKTYTTLNYGNDHGNIAFGHINKQGDVVNDILLQASDGRHSIALSKDGELKGCTQITAPGRIAIDAASDAEFPEGQIAFHCYTHNGDIVITAKKGNLILSGVNVEINAIGEGTKKGNVTIDGSQNILLKSKVVQVNARSRLYLISTGVTELVGKGCLKIYGGLIQGVTDSVSGVKPRNGGTSFWNKYQK